jgi:hypothetical protein
VKLDHVVFGEVRKVSQEKARAKESRGLATIEFGDGTRGTLDLSLQRDRVWAEVLQSLHERRSPAYVKLDAGSGRITLLLMPSEQRVVALEEDASGDLRVEFDPSQAIHWLRRRHPQFEATRDLLARALRGKRSLLVTDALDSPEIVDVREKG